MNISDEAVDAAYDVSTHLNITTSDIERILEAAAPHLMAQAWEAGCQEGLSYNPGYHEEALSQNPYRKPTDAD